MFMQAYTSLPVRPVEDINALMKDVEQRARIEGAREALLTVKDNATNEKTRKMVAHMLCTLDLKGEVR